MWLALRPVYTSERQQKQEEALLLGEKTASQVKEIGQYVQSQSGILEKLLWFLNRAVYRSTAQPVRSRCKRPHTKLHVLFFRPRDIPLPLASCVNVTCSHSTLFFFSQEATAPSGNSVRKFGPRAHCASAIGEHVTLQDHVDV